MYDRLVVEKDPKSPVSEAFRSMRTNVHFSNIDSNLKTIVMTSPKKSDGKSTIISNYGLTLAQSDKRVLLIDCDLRRPNIHKIFNVPNNKGLTNVIIKQNTWEEVVQSTPLENVYIISSGPIPPNPSEMLGSNSMKFLLEKLRDIFDYVLIDAPPVGIVTDAAVLSTISDGVIVTVSIGKTEKELFKRTIETLNNVGANIIGTVINNAPVNKGNYYYNYYYSEDQGKKKKKKKRRNKKLDKKMAVEISAKQRLKREEWE